MHCACVHGAYSGGENVCHGEVVSLGSVGSRRDPQRTFFQCYTSRTGSIPGGDRRLQVGGESFMKERSFQSLVIHYS